MRSLKKSTDIGSYLTLRNGTEIQITGFRVVRNEGFFTVRYPDKLVTGDTYEYPEGEIYAAKASKKYSN